MQYFEDLLKQALSPQPYQWVYKTYAPPHAEKCPICEGKGMLPDTEKEVIKCHGCQGKGWITITPEIKGE
jgi:DnaJ-class molecular chaperone